jgi:hypothetical protein
MCKPILWCLLLAAAAGCKKNTGLVATATSATIQVVFPDAHSYTYTNSSSPISGGYGYLYSPTGIVSNLPVNYVVYNPAVNISPVLASHPAYNTYVFNYLANAAHGHNQSIGLVTPAYFNYTNFSVDSASSNPVFLGSLINIQDTVYAYYKMNISSSFADTTQGVYTGNIRVLLYPKLYLAPGSPFFTYYRPSSPITINFSIANIGYY